MPALYAHNQFGANVANRLDGEIKEIVKKYYTQFRIGLQGPDIFFFYRPFIKTTVSQCGYGMHNEYADGFFEKAAEVIRKRGRNSREYAYILGFICHFSLDSECHPYVERMVEKIQVGHMEIEGEFEKYLLRKDNRDALAYPVWKYIPTDDSTVETIYQFFKHIKKVEIKESLQTLKFIKRFFVAPGKIKQAFINLILKVTGLKKHYYGLMHSYYDNPKCEETNEELYKKFQNAILVAVKLILSYDETVQQKTMINGRFHRTYD